MDVKSSLTLFYNEKDIYFFRAECVIKKAQKE